MSLRQPGPLGGGHLVWPRLGWALALGGASPDTGQRGRQAWGLRGWKGGCSAVSSLPRGCCSATSGPQRLPHSAVSCLGPVSSDFGPRRCEPGGHPGRHGPKGPFLHL